MKNIPGVSGGEHDPVQSPPARISLFTSPSQPSLTPSIFPKKNGGLETGVRTVPHVDGGLLAVLPVTDRGGVEGDTYTSGALQDVSTERCCPSNWYTKECFECIGRGEANGVTTG